MTKPLDPLVEPPGYQPPTSAEELLERYAAGERYFVGAQLGEAELVDAELEGANLSEADLSRADLWGARLTGGLLTSASLRGANLAEASLAVVELSDADFTGATFGRTDLTYSDLANATLADTTHRGAGPLDRAMLAATGKGLSGASVERIEEVTHFLLDFGFHEDDIPWSIPTSQGLTLCFNTRLSAVDRFLVDGVLYGVLGLDTEVGVAEFRQEEDTAVVRLEGGSQEDLEAVADALWERVWEDIGRRTAERAQEQALARLDSLFRLREVAPALTDLRDRLDRIELRLPSEDALERLDDLGQEHVQAKDHNLIRTWGQKVARGAGKAAVKKLTGMAGKEVEEVVKGLVKGMTKEDGDG